MKRVLLSLVIAAAALGAPAGQPKLVGSVSAGYRVGDTIDPATYVVDNRQQRVRLMDLMEPDTRVAVVIFFGGAAARINNPQRFRGRLWCRDSFDDLAVQRAAVQYFEDRAVRFIPVAVPPVYRSARFGFGEDSFLGQAPDSAQYADAVTAFIEATEAERRNTVLPFDQIYYDPRFRLAQNRRYRELGPEYGRVEPWQGKFRWHLDPRRYGTPAIWLLGPDGRVLQEPLVGNDYDASPPEIYYGFSELKAAIEKHLAR